MEVVLSGSVKSTTETALSMVRRVAVYSRSGQGELRKMYIAWTTGGRVPKDEKDPGWVTLAKVRQMFESSGTRSQSLESL